MWLAIIKNQDLKINLKISVKNYVNQKLLDNI